MLAIVPRDREPSLLGNCGEGAAISTRGRMRSPEAIDPLGQMQDTPHRIGQGPCYLLRIILLQSRDRGPNVV